MGSSTVTFPMTKVSASGLGKSAVLTDFLNAHSGYLPSEFDQKILARLADPEELKLFEADLKARTEKRNEHIFGALPRTFSARLRRERSCHIGDAWFLVAQAKAKANAQKV